MPIGGMVTGWAGPGNGMEAAGYAMGVAPGVVEAGATEATSGAPAPIKAASGFACCACTGEATSSQQPRTAARASSEPRTTSPFRIAARSPR